MMLNDEALDVARTSLSFLITSDYYVGYVM